MVPRRGQAVSNVRKGSTKNAWELRARVHFSGSRGGVNATVTVASGELDLDTCVAASPAGPGPGGLGGPGGLSGLSGLDLEVDLKPGQSVVKEKVVGPDGAVVEHIVGEIDAERVMRNNEFFFKLVKTKGLELVRSAIATLVSELSTHGKSMSRPSS